MKLYITNKLKSFIICWCNDYRKLIWQKNLIFPRWPNFGWASRKLQQRELATGIQHTAAIPPHHGSSPSYILGPNYSSDKKEPYEIVTLLLLAIKSRSLYYCCANYYVCLRKNIQLTFTWERYFVTVPFGSDVFLAFLFCEPQYFCYCNSLRFTINLLQFRSVLPKMVPTILLTIKKHFHL